MKATLNNLINLSSHKSYYLNADDEIESLSFTEKLKSCLDIKRSRDRALNLLEKIRTILLDNADLEECASLDEALVDISLYGGIRGFNIRNIIKDFFSLHKQKCELHYLLTLLNPLIDDAVTALIKNGAGRIKDSTHLRNLFENEVRVLLNKLPSSDLNSTLEKDLLLRVKTNLAALSEHLLAVSEDENLKRPCITAEYAKYMAGVLYQDNNCRKDDFSAIKAPSEALRSLLCISLKDSKSHDCAIEQGINLLLEEMSLNVELETLLIEGGSNILLKKDKTPYTLEEIKVRIEKLKDNLKETKTLHDESIKCAARVFLEGLKGEALEKGTLCSIENCALNASYLNFKDINDKSSLKEIFNGLNEIMLAGFLMVHKLNLKEMLKSSDALKRFLKFFYTIVLNRLTEDEKTRIYSVFLSHKITELYHFLENDVALIKHKNTDSVKKQLSSYAVSMCDSLNLLNEVLGQALGLNTRKIQKMIRRQKNTHEMKTVYKTLMASVSELIRTKNECFVKNSVACLHHEGFYEKILKLINTHALHDYSLRLYDEVYAPLDIIDALVARNLKDDMDARIEMSMNEFNLSGMSTGFEKTLKLKTAGLKDGTILSHNPWTALDTLARFIQNDENVTYESLTLHDKTRVNIIASFICGNTLKSLNNTLLRTLNDRVPLFRIGLYGEEEEDCKTLFMLSHDKDSISISMHYRQKVLAISLESEIEETLENPVIYRSSIAYTFTYDELARAAHAYLNESTPLEVLRLPHTLKLYDCRFDNKECAGQENLG